VAPSRDESIYILLNNKISREEFEKEIRELKEEVNKDISELKQDVKEIRGKDIPELQKALVQNQQATLRRIIAVQATVLTLILAAIVPLVLKILFHL
jgi:predicted neutral ceramidase superfamily lipid hydrolase